MFINKIKSCFNPLIRSNINNCLKRYFMKQNNFTERDDVASSIKLLIKPFLFTVGFTGCAFAGAAIWQYESSVRKRLFLRNYVIDRPKAGDLRNKINKWWNEQNNGVKVFAGIALINGLVFLAWKVPSLQSFMVRYFASAPTGRSLPCLPMILSVFSHKSFVHLSINMLVLFSLTSLAAFDFGKEQYLAFYLSSGVVSSFCSYLHKIITKTYPLSLGASGAILGILASSCELHPDVKLMIIFLPFFTIPASVAIKGIILFDAAGILLKWQIFDHAAHLGGALFGIWYSSHGYEAIWDNRGYLIKKWKEIKDHTKLD